MRPDEAAYIAAEAQAAQVDLAYALVPDAADGGAVRARFKILNLGVDEGAGEELTDVVEEGGDDGGVGTV